MGVFSIFESNPPLGLCSISTIAKIRGHEVKIFDQLLHHYNSDELIETIKNYRPDMVGFACTSLNISTSLLCAKRLKHSLSCVCLGGIHITLCTKEVMEENVFDFLLNGEGEEIFLTVLSVIEKSDLNELQHTAEKGIWLKEQNSDNSVTILSDINQPIIDRSLLKLNIYITTKARCLAKLLAILCLAVEVALSLVNFAASRIILEFIAKET